MKNSQIFIISFIFFTLSANATNYFVSPNGSNTNTGLTTNTAFATITFASTIANHGDTIYVLGGTYTNASYGVWNPYKIEQAVRINNKNSNSGNYLVIMPYNNNAVKIKSDGNFIFQIRNSSYIKIIGFELEGETARIPIDSALKYQFAYRQCINADCTQYIDTFRVPFGTPESVVATMTLPLLSDIVRPSTLNADALLLQNCHHIDIINNHVHHSTSAGIRVAGSDYINVLNNEINDCNKRTSVGTPALVLSLINSIDNNNAVKILISGNRVHNNENQVYSWSPLKTYITPLIDEGKGISLEHCITRPAPAASWAFGRVRIENNLCYWNGLSGINTNEAERVDIVNNTCYQNISSGRGTNTGISINETIDANVINNIVVSQNNFGGAALASRLSNNLQVANNVVLGTLDSDIDALDVNTIFGNAFFNNEAIQDFTITSQSPALNAGLRLWAPLLDITGINRDTLPDIGAFEFPESGCSAGGTLEGTTHVCEGINEINLTLSANIGSIIEWQFSRTPDFANFISITNTTQNLTAANLTESRYYRVKVKNGNCFPAFSSTAFIEFKRRTADTVTAAICQGNVYNWNGQSYNLAGLYSDTLTNSAGCDSIVVLQLIVKQSTTSTTNMVICTGSSVNWNGILYSNPGTYTIHLLNADGCDSSATLILTNVSIKPTTPSSISQVLVDNNCGARIYRYTATVSSLATGYSWILPSAVGGISGAIIDSGSISSSRIIRVKYASNAAALVSDSIKVVAYNSCGQSAFRGAKLVNTAWSGANTPVISTTTLVSNICGARIVRYSVPVPSASAGSLIGYEWSFVGDVLGANAVIDSPVVNGYTSRVIVVKYSSNAGAAANDSVRFRYIYNNGCSSGIRVSVKIGLKELTVPAAPIISQTIVSNNCSSRIVRYTASSLRAATTSSLPATGYVWTLPTGTVGSTCVLDSGVLTTPPGAVAETGRSIRVRYLSNDIANQDTMKVAYLSDCGNSLNANLIVSLPVLNNTGAPSSIIIQKITDLQCNKPRYRYIAPPLPSGNGTTLAARGYEWRFAGSLLAQNFLIDSGSSQSQVITVTFGSTATAALNDSVKLRYLTDCGNGPWLAVRLINKIYGTNAPKAPVSITMNLIENNCASRIYRYIAPNLPLSNSVSTAATGYQWTLPSGPLGSNGTLDSGTVNSKIIRIKYLSNQAASPGDSIGLKYTSPCGNSPVKTQQLNNSFLNCFSRININAQNNIQPEKTFVVNVFPNPSAKHFTIFVNGNPAEIVTINIKDVLGRNIETHYCRTVTHYTFGEKLGKGIYFAVIKIGNKTETVTRIIKD